MCEHAADLTNKYSLDYFYWTFAYEKTISTINATLISDWLELYSNEGGRIEHVSQ